MRIDERVPTEPRAVPNFFVVGALKAGTTSFYRDLSAWLDPARPRMSERLECRRRS